MNITESFDQFSSRMSGMDLALYAGVGLVLWILFKDKLSPVQKLLLDLFNKFNVSNPKLPVIEVPNITPVTTPSSQTDDTFFKLVVSWKQTRDLAEKSNCVEAIKVADQMFPFLSPNVCKKEEKV
ncbi:hypothetical protein EBU24_00415 [bacterium]|nr:hypothetical protein [bacterium]